MKLFKFPKELIQIVSSHLPKQSLSRLCSTCTEGYSVFLPVLYEHIELRHRAQIKQLKEGIIRNASLRHAVKSYTTKLTLKCRQSGSSNWMILSLFEALPNIKSLFIHDFSGLSMDRLQQVLSTLPRITHLSLHYCDIITSTTTTAISLPSLTNISLLWTDFTTESITQLFQLAPKLNCISLGANRNRKPHTNDSALLKLIQYCPKINKLSISLQQLKEATLCKVIHRYSSQLVSLSIRCEGNDTLKVISKYTQNLKQLVIRCNNHTSSDHVVHLLQECKYLNRLEMIDWPINNFPSTVLDHVHHRNSITLSIRSDSSSSRSLSTRFVQGVQKTVALDKYDLQEIRRLYIYNNRTIENLL